MKNIIKNILDFRSLKTDKKLVVITSDDWGSVRIRSRRDQLELKKLGINLNNRFDRFDSLESNKDLETLFEVLLEFKDHKGNHPVITAVSNVANPDFSKIKTNDFRKYCFQDLKETLQNYPNHDRVMQLYEKGIDMNIFVPESHGREHLQINWWMHELRNPASMVRKAFDHNFFFLNRDYLVNKNFPGLGAAFNIYDEKDLETHKRTAASALSIFKDLFGYTSSYFTPPAMHHHVSLEKTLSLNGIKWLDQPRWQKMPVALGRTKNRFHYLGQKGKTDLRYLVRNCVFEANMSENDNGVSRCLADIKAAFRAKQPAIISNHRASFVGEIEEANRDNGLKSLELLLKSTLKMWPDAEFITIGKLEESL